MKKPKFKVPEVNEGSTIFDELLMCYKSTEFYPFVRTEPPTHIRHLWRTIFIVVAWVAIVLFLTLYVKFLTKEVQLILIVSVFFGFRIILDLQWYVYSDGSYIPLNIYRRKLIDSFISSRTTDYPRLADRLIQICNNESDSDTKAVSISVLGCCVTVVVMIFGFVFSYMLEGYKEFLTKNNCPLLEPQAVDVFVRIIYVLIIPIIGSIFILHILSKIGVSKSDKMRNITKSIQESLLEREFRNEK